MKDWAIRYVEAKDIFTKTLKAYDVKEDYVEFDFGAYKHYYLFQQKLNQEILSKAEKYEKKTIVCEKNNENYNFLIENFEKLAAMKGLILIFLSKDKARKLLLNPHAHGRIADPETLKEGLKTMWDNS